MTSQLRKKRPTTALAARAGKRTSAALLKCVAIGSLVTCVFTAIETSAYAAPKLKWKPYRAVTTEERAQERASTLVIRDNQVRQANAIVATVADKDPFGDSPAKDLPTTEVDDLDVGQSGIPDDPLERRAGEKPKTRDDELDSIETMEDHFPESRTPNSRIRSNLNDNKRPFPEEEAPNDVESSPSDQFSDPNSPMRNEPKGCAAEKADCADAFARLKSNTIANIDLSIDMTGAEGVDFPCECPFAVGETFVPRNWTCMTYNWKASGLCHKPLYFEQVAVERYGHSMTPLLQDVMCGVHFFATLPCLPYMMGMCPPNECQYSLGYYRPGNCAPYLVDPIPLSARGGLLEATAIVGGILIIP